MFVVYDILYFLFTILYFPYVILKKKWHRGFKARMGMFSDALKQEIGGGKKIWVHAVSVGEVMAVAGLIHKIKERYALPIVVTVVTQTGYQLAQNKIGKQVTVIYAPLDFSFTVRYFIRQIQPAVYITAETEIWPNLFYALFRRSVPVIVVNGRISDRAFGHYRLAKILFAPLLRKVSAICVQSAVDAQRFIVLGARPTSVFVSGNFKFDEISLLPAVPAGALQLGPGQLVWIAGSTHPGEEDVVLDVFAALQKDFSALRLVLAPRHVERVAAIRDLIAQRGFKPLLYSAGVNSSDPQEVVLVDTIGHLRYLFASADVVFMGKSLTGRGGQNFLEPAFFRKPVIVGPHVQNFRKIAEIFLAGNALVQVKDPSELLTAMRDLLRDPNLRERLGQSAYRLIGRNQGATQKAFEIISRFLPV